ncbi:histidine phosphatase family protein [Glaciecola sp. 1036]|uniref:histidine phosphatase family protein n=1 Tax=Alteromonadaceae TaxID=72275 RepID=UPI003D034A4E
MAELFLVRHAQASYGSGNYDQLSPLGHEQSQLLGQYFKEREITFDKLICGDMQRHKETLTGITGAFKNVEINHQWNEFAFEDVINAFLKQHPELTPAKDSSRKQWYRVLKAAMVAWSENRINENLPETWEDFQSRVKQASKKIAVGTEKKVLVVSSGGAIAVFLQQLFDLTPSQAVNFNLQIKNSSLHHFYFNKEGFQMSSFNSIPHLEPLSLMEKITYS